MMTRKMAWAPMVASALVSMACGGEAEAPTPLEPVDVTGIEPEAPSPTEVSSTSGCALDADCAAGMHCFLGACAAECDAERTCTSAADRCDERGRCIGEGEDHTEDAAGQVSPELRIVDEFARVWRIAAGQDEVVVSFMLNEAPTDALPYRVERADLPDANQAVRRMSIDGRVASVTLAVGAASPDLGDEARTTQVTLHTSFGSFFLTLLPDAPAAGVYAGNVVVDTFGSTGLPLEFEVVTEPAGASLESATSAWLVLPVGFAQVFSPLTEGAASPEEIARPLEFDAFTGSWVATFSSAFDLSGATILSYDDPSQIERSMRFELESLEEGELRGSFRDRWTGLYDERSIDGVISLGDVTYRGLFTMRQVGLIREADGVDTNPALPAAAPRTQPAPSIAEACSAVPGDLFDASWTDDGQTHDCDTIGTLDDFEAAGPLEQGSCAIAIARASLASDTTAQLIQAFLSDETPNPGGKSFTEFMEECAAGVDGTCRPSQQVLCGRQLTAYSARVQPARSPRTAPLIAAYADTTREAFLGRQFGAYRTDIETRLTWLRTTSYPAVVTSAVRDLNERLIGDWRDNVLEVHFQVLQGQFDRAGLSILSRELEGEDAIEARQALLLEMNQSFRATLDALTLAAGRWDELFVDAASRREVAMYVGNRTRQLYLLAGVLKQLNLEGGSGALSAANGAGFAALSRELERLDQTFNQLLYARDAEVVISTSVDPTVGNDELLGMRKAQALEDIDDATRSVQEVIEQAEAEALSELQLRNRLDNEVDALRDEIVALCGLPQGCSTADLDTRPECAPRVEPGECGFVFITPREGAYAEDPEALEASYASLGAPRVSASEAGRTLLAIVEAIGETNIARVDLNAQVQRITLLAQNTESYENKVREWLVQAQDYQRELEARTQVLLDSNDREHAALVEMITGEVTYVDPATGELTPQLPPVIDPVTNKPVMGGQAGLRKRILDERQRKVDGWFDTNLGRTIEKWATEIGFEVARFGVEQGFGTAISSLEEGRDAELSAIPDGTMDPFSALRLAINLRYAPSIIGLKRARNIASFSLDKLEWANQRRKEIQALQSQDKARKFEQRVLWNEEAIQRVQEAFDLRTSEEQGLREATRDIVNMLTETIRISRAMDRDVIELQDRRTALLQEMVELEGLRAQIEQASLGIDQRMLDYDGVVQRAQLLHARLQALEQQRQDVNRLLGSPTAVFSRANKVLQAENRLERAKSRLMDWLVALEYFAVRPFMDQRIQILLARNPYQLEEIAQRLSDLQSRCGGAVNQQVSDLSLRQDLLHIDQPWRDEVAQAVVAPGARLRQMMREGYIPIDRRVRYTAEESVGGLLSRTDGSVLTASFDVDLEDFANLEVTCNAKIESVSIQLVGDGLGSGRPTVSLFYDGQATLQSCQPDIDDYVAQFGPGATRFGARTQVQVVGRGASPVAGVNTFLEGNVNTTLAGLPLASRYTVLIDTQVGENASFDWSKLEDVRLRVSYTSQDLFPDGQCE